jgi:hypothetical protein
MAQRLVFAWEDIPQLDLQPAQDRFQLVERDVVFASLNTVERRMRHADLPGEIGVGKAATRLPQIPRKLTIEIPLHPRRLAK